MSACPTCGATNPDGARFCNACGTSLEPTARTTEATSGERRVVTMLFCDVRGSTSMAELLDPEEWTEIMNQAYERLIEPVVRYEGTVARLMGDAILAFFGAPTAHEDDPQRAVMAGLEIVTAIGPLRERLAREHGMDLNVRVGINTGPVVVGEVGSEFRREYSAMGDAVNVAARMEQTAEPGTVQITEDTHRLVADLFEVEPLGAVELKGKRRPVRSYRVRGRRSAPWKVRAAATFEAPIIGREAELAALRSAFDRLREGRGSILLITGDPGLGKTRLVEEANALWAEREPDDDRRWDFWHCVPYDVMQPYAQYRRVIRERAGISETDAAEVVRSKIAAFMTIAPEGWQERSERLARALLGVELAEEPKLEGEAFHREATEVIVGSTVAQGGRRLIVFEDLHWCDQASLELVRATAELAVEGPIICLITFRPDRAAASWTFKEGLETDLAEQTRLLELRQLTDAQSARVLEDLLPIEGMSEDVRGRILDRTEGNPLFLQEVVRDLIDRGVAERVDDDGWRLVGDADAVTIPDTVQRLITVGLDRLAEGPRRALQTAAVIGRTFDADLLGAVTQHADLAAELGELEGRDLIRASAHAGRREYSFRHALTQEAAYGTLLLKDRRAMHRRVAEALEAEAGEHLDDVAAVLVRHFAEAGDDDATLRFALIAGDAAARLYANAEAAAHFATALEIARRMGPDLALVRSVGGRLGSALELAGRHEEAIAVYEEIRDTARTAGDAQGELAANSAIALLYSTASPLFDPERGLALSEDIVVAAAALEDRVAEARALWNIVVASVYGGGDPARAVEAGERSLSIARELGEREQLAFILNDVSRAHMAVGDFATAAERLREARGIWEEIDNRPMLGENLTLRSEMRLMAGDHVGALEEAREAVAIAASTGNRWGESFALIAVYRVQRDLGDLGAAMDSMRRCMEVGELGGFAYAGIAARADLARCHLACGDAAGALPLAERALSLSHELGMPSASLAQAIRAEALLALGDLAGAKAAVDGTEVGQLPEPDRTFAFGAMHLARAHVAIATGAPGKAVVAAEQALEHLRSNGVRILIAEQLVASAKARLAEGSEDDATRALTEAVTEAEGLGERAPLWEALALLAEIQSRHGSAVEASALRRRARRVVDEIADGIDDLDLREGLRRRPEVVALDERDGSP